MNPSSRWDRCILQRGDDVGSFVRTFISQPHRHLLMIAGGGFDPRATCLCEVLSKAIRSRLQAVFLREERPNADAEIRTRAEANVKRLLEFVPAAKVEEIQIFATDNAVVGGREAIKVLSKLAFEGITDFVVDCSALSRGVTFPVVKFILERAGKRNVHVFVLDEPFTDDEISPLAWEQAGYILGFRGKTSSASAVAHRARLWLPQLVLGQRAALDLIYRMVQPNDVCPILPFPGGDPKLSDRLIELYGVELESGWKVDPRNIVYADERNPLDLYRVILRIDDARSRVFREVGGSQIILSPIGSKLLSLGAMMAALERGFPVVYVEAVGYRVDFSKIDRKRRQPGPLVHLWLHGEAYAEQ